MLGAASCPSEAAAAELKGPWLAEVLAALLLRASELREGAPPPAQEAAWHAAFDALLQRLLGHLQVLQVGHVALHPLQAQNPILNPKVRL